jgi:hypothetical protein
LKRFQLLAVAVLALMLLSAFPVRIASGQGAYSEKLNVYVAGSDALWYFTYSGINSSSELSALESTPGLSWYNVTAISTIGWVSDMQIFGPRGYNLLPVPFTPSQGMFLTVGSDSFGDASAAAAALDPYLLTSFVSLSNGTGSYAFYSPISFSTLIPSTLFKFIPSSEGGFAGAVGSSFLLSSASPFIVLEGQKTSSGFSHTLVVGSISGTALNGTDQPNLVGYFSSTASSLQASSKSSSSTVQIRFLDGIISSSDKATISNDRAKFTGSYTLNLTPGDEIFSVNATVVQQPAPLLAYREVDTGVLRTGDNISVTLVLKNLSPSDTISKVTFSDNWWNSSSEFRLLKGSNFTVPTASIQAGGSVTPVYRLQYTGTTSGTITIPASAVRYQYLVEGKTFNATTVLNPIRLSLGIDDAVVYATIIPIGGFDQPLGSAQKYNVTVTNVGTLPASSVGVAGKSIAGLAAKSGGSPGGSATVTATQTLTGLVNANGTTSYLAAYQNPSGNTFNATTNVVPTIFSHSSMSTGFPILTVGAKLATLANLQSNLTLTFTTTDPGFANITDFRATGSLPSGLGCGRVNGTGLTCTSGRVTISYPTVNKSNTLLATMQYNLTTPMNYLMGSFSFQALTSGVTVNGMSNAVAIPGGLILSKSYNPSQLFGGMSSMVKVSAANSGPLELYSATVGSTVDSFDTLSNAATLSKTFTSINAGANESVSYGVTASQTFGSFTGTPATTTFFFGGTSFTVNSAAPKVQVYQPLTVTISTYPTTPEEGKNFTITFTIRNPSGVQVSNVLFTLPIPSGLGLTNLHSAQVTNGMITINAGTLAANGTATSTANAVASSGITIPFVKGVLTFSYAGVTVNGIVPTGSGIAIGEDITTRYLIPTAFVLLVLLFTAYYVRRKAIPTVPASPK